MKKLNLLLSLVLLFQAAYAFPQSSKIDSIIRNVMDENHIPGAATIIVKEGKVIYENYFGYSNLQQKKPVNHNTIFMVASISKIITATALMNENENGSFQLRDSIDRYTPFKVRNPNHPETPITFFQLLTHTSSIKDNWDVLFPLYVNGDSPLDFETLFRGYLVPGGVYYTDDNFYDFAPGKTFEYGNASTAFCGYLVESITKTPFNEYCNDSIISPLGMHNTAWFLSELNLSQVAMPYTYKTGEFKERGHYGFPDYPNGQLRTTVVSLAKFIQIFLNNGRFDNKQVLNPKTVDNMLSIQIPDLDINQGLIFNRVNLNNVPVWGHDGGDSGVTTFARFYKSNKTIIIGFFNQTVKEVKLEKLKEEMLQFAGKTPADSGTLLEHDFKTSGEKKKTKSP